MSNTALDHELRIVVWNVEWRPPTSRAADTIRQRIGECQPDIVCLTETLIELWDAPGHTICADADYGYDQKPSRRKVLLWSRTPWRGADNLGSPELPSGRYVRGHTSTSLGEVDVTGVCIPWAGAHVSTGRRDRRRWQDHLFYLTALDPLLRAPRARSLVMGDFNQTVPRRMAPVAAYAALESAMLSRFELATAGVIDHGMHAVDHLAHSSDLCAVEVSTLSRFGPAGERLSDHFGLFLRLRDRPSTPR